MRFESKTRVRERSNMRKRIMDRLRILFSFEFVLTIAVISILRKIPAVNRWISQPYTLDLTKGADAVLQQMKQHQNSEDIRIFLIELLVIILVFGIGEIVRRKLKYRSLFR